MSDCMVCDAGLVLDWCDLHGQAVCVRCGTPYSVAGYNGRSTTECAIKPEAIPLLRAYWLDTSAWSGLGTYLGDEGGRISKARGAFNAWTDAHPELMPAAS